MQAAAKVSLRIPHLTNGLYPCLWSPSLEVPINISALSLTMLILILLSSFKSRY